MYRSQTELLGLLLALQVFLWTISVREPLWLSSWIHNRLCYIFVITFAQEVDYM